MTRSEQLFAEAQRFIPGGVNSPVRAFRGVGGTPIFFKRGEGASLYDEDDRRYIDYVGSWGPMIVGHAHPAVVRAVQEAAANGLSFGAPTAIETIMARKIARWFPRWSWCGCAIPAPGHHERHPTGAWLHRSQ